MKKDYGEFSVEWIKADGNILVKYETYNDHAGECEPATELLTLFEFLSSLGITKRQCMRAFDDEDDA
jgi:hypothetical protein